MSADGGDDSRGDTDCPGRRHGLRPFAADTRVRADAAATRERPPDRIGAPDRIRGPSKWRTALLVLVGLVAIAFPFSAASARYEPKRREGAL